LSLEGKSVFSIAMRNAERVVQLMMGELMGSYMTAASLFSG
jgi:hypothetical protein